MITPVFIFGLVFLLSFSEITEDNIIENNKNFDEDRTLDNIRLFHFFITLAYSTYSCSHIYFGMIFNVYVNRS